jgi:ABC-type polysaccharide/polyol phosphate transport system ATPase subunit
MTPLIEVHQVYKRYRIGRGLTNLRELFSIHKELKSKKYYWAIKDVSFEIQPGESLGIIGPNGAGKSTILKILSRVTYPTKGEVHVNGRLSALIELGAGFHPDLSGRDNIYLNGAILGMPRPEIKARFEEIVDFAGIGDYLDTPVKRYSSGMYARLGFAIAAHVNPQVFLVDEVLAVGDYAFQMKCFARMAELRAKGAALIFVSHNMEAVRQVCDRGIVLYRGEAIFQGPASDAVLAYSDAIRASARQTRVEVPIEEGISQRVMTFDAEIEKVQLLDEQGQPVTTITPGQVARVVVDARMNKDVQKPIFSMTIRTPNGHTIYDTTTRWMDIRTPDFVSGDRCQIEFELTMHLLNGEFELGVDIAASDFSHLYDSLERALGFTVVGANGAKGSADLGAKVRISRIDVRETRHGIAEV